MTQDFKNLNIWQTSFQLSKKIYLITRNFPKEELYGITSQLRRATLSIPTNIAEGCGRRTYRDFRSFLYNALGSCLEVENLLIFSKELSYIDETTFNQAINEFVILRRRILCLINKVSSKTHNS